MLRRILFINTILALTFLSISMIKEDNVIKWSPDRSLRIEDFIEVESLLPGNVAATSTTGITMSTTHYGTIVGHDVYAVFYKDQSYWCKKNGKHILKHEQGHFDITHYIATQLKKALKGCKSTEECNKCYDEHIAKLDSMQKKYDIETDYSRDSIAQVKWNKYIESLLR